VRCSGIHQRADRLRRQGDALLYRLQLLIKLGNTRCSLLLLTGDFT
jgi:hypothetical protein